MTMAGIDGMSGGITALTRRQWMGWMAAGVAATAGLSPARLLAQPAERFPALRAYIADLVASRRLPGAIAAIGLGDAPLALVADGTLAMDSRTPVDADSLWRIYSMTKPITGIAAMMLVEEGRFTLDTPVYDILPAYRDMRVLLSPDGPLDQSVPADSAITIRHLLTHTAGFAYSFMQSGPIKAAYEEQGIVPTRVSRMNVPGLFRGTPAPSLELFADRLAQLPLLHQPGAKWTYSVGLDLLGRVIEVVSGQPFDAFLQTRLLDPLRMASTGFSVPAAARGRLATNYAPLGGMLVPIDPGTESIFFDPPPFPFGGSGLISSARDYDRFLHMLMNLGELDGERILSPQTAQTAMSNLLPAGMSLDGVGLPGAGFGAGGRVSLASAPEGAGVFGWGGAAGTTGLVDAGRRIRFGSYANYMPADAIDFQRRMPELLRQDLAGMART